MATDPMQNSPTQDSEMAKLYRFLTYGHEGGSYNVREKSKEVSLECAQYIMQLIEDGKGEDVVKEICTFSKNALSVEQDPLILSLAACAKLSKDLKTKKAALKAVIEVCPSAPQLFRFVEYTEKLSGSSTGWGRGQRKAVSEWYIKKESGALGEAVTRYVQRNGWSHLDLIRLAHIKPEKDGKYFIFWIGC